MPIVQKFGGSSLADAGRLRRAAELCERAFHAGKMPAVVVSAMGKDTDALLSLARELAGEPPQRELDALLATGEARSAALLAMVLHSRGIPALSLTGWQAGIRTDGCHGDAAITAVEPLRVERALARGQLPVVCGFQGISEDGELTTLGRGGSDTSAVALAGALGAEECRIYTDVDGIFTADPRLVPEARLLPVMDSADMLILARSGSRVLHHKCMELAVASGQSLRLLSSFTEGEGTLVCPLPEEERPLFSGVTGRQGTVTLVGRGAALPVLRRLSRALAEAGCTPLSAVLQEGALCFRLPPEQTDAALRRVHREIFEGAGSEP